MGRNKWLILISFIFQYIKNFRLLFELNNMNTIRNINDYFFKIIFQSTFFALFPFIIVIFQNWISANENVSPWFFAFSKTSGLLNLVAIFENSFLSFLENNYTILTKIYCTLSKSGLSEKRWHLTIKYKLMKRSLVISFSSKILI